MTKPSKGGLVSVVWVVALDTARVESLEGAG